MKVYTNYMIKIDKLCRSTTLSHLNNCKISRSVRITHAGSLGMGLGLGGLGAGGCGGGVKGCISHDILYLLIICQMSKCQTP